MDRQEPTPAPPLPLLTVHQYPPKKTAKAVLSQTVVSKKYVWCGVANRSWRFHSHVFDVHAVILPGLMCPSFVCWSCARHLGGCSTNYIHPAVAKMLSNGWLFQLHSSSLLLPSENILGRKNEERVIIIIIFIHHAVRQAASALPGDFPRHIGNYGNSHRFLRHLDIWGWLPEILTASNLFQRLFFLLQLHLASTWHVPGTFSSVPGRKFLARPGMSFTESHGADFKLDIVGSIAIDLSNLYVRTPWQPSWSWDLPVDRCGAWRKDVQENPPFPWADFIANGPSASEIKHSWGVAYPRHLACAEPRWKELT
jgi:hypothetical protein